MFKRKHLSRGEAATLIDAFLDGSLDDDWAWDDFCSLGAKDPDVERARLRCVQVHDEFPPGEGSTAYCNAKGTAVLRRVAEDLRMADSA
jgi:hypothetical protein